MNRQAVISSLFELKPLFIPLTPSVQGSLLNLDNGVLCTPLYHPSHRMFPIPPTAPAVVLPIPPSPFLLEISTLCTHTLSHPDYFFPTARYVCSMIR